MIGALRTFAGAAFALGLAAVVGGCSSNLTQPDPFRAERCEPPPALLLGVSPQPFTLGMLHDAVVHAAGPMAAALGSSDQVTQIMRAMEGMAARDGSEGTDTACRLLIVAADALDAIGDDPETLPDRDGIRLVLILAAGVIQARSP